MAWIRWDLVFSIGLFISPACVSMDQPRNGFRKLYVVPGGTGAGDAVHLRSGAAGQGHAQPVPHRPFNVELSASYGGQVRTRRMGNQNHPVPIPIQQQQQDARYTQHQQVIRHSSSSSSSSSHSSVQQNHHMKMSGVNQCGTQCCHGWSKTQGSQRCTKPNCIPQCQNGGMCLRPQLCICKPGSKGKACEQKTPSTSTFPGLPGNGHNGGHTNGHTGGHTGGHNVVPQRPIPQQASPQAYGHAPPPLSNVAQMRLSQMVRPQYMQQQIRPIPLHPVHNQQYVMKPKYYHVHSPHTQSHGQPQPDHAIPLLAGHNGLLVSNHTGRIKVVFTPTICKVTCMGGRCHNNCEMGNTTTIISENGHATDTLTAPNFRVVVCHLPCINGGKCSARNKCQCPPNFTGKFCQVAVQGGQHQQSGGYGQTHVHATHTLPLTYSNGQNSVKFGQGIVNIHVKHPPEASVQIHQVSQLDTLDQASPQAGSSSSFTYHHVESSQKVRHHGHSVAYPSRHGYQVPQGYQPVTSKSQLGRCFQETQASQCGKALPGLSKQDECCGSVGTSWGFNKCQQCPNKPSIPPMDCPAGYKRINISHCQDVNECQLQGVCPNGECLNTVGSYRCRCKAGFIPDPSLATCIPYTAVQEEKGACYRLVTTGKQCLHPVSAQLSKQLCCCSVGKAWGPRCDPCPLPGTAKFKDICPGGMGYTVLPKPPVNKPIITYQEPVVTPRPRPLPTPEKPVEAFGEPDKPIPVATPTDDQLLTGVSDRTLVDPIQPQLSPGVFTVKMETAYPEVYERSSPPAPVELLPSNAGQDIAPTQSAEVNECMVSPRICGKGICYNLVEGYTCHCDEGHRLDTTRTTCVDIDECVENPSLCSRGRCRNTPGSFLCVCQSGFTTDEEGTACIDLDECQTPSLCPDGETCFNTQGSFFCRGCERGFRLTSTGACTDIDECVNRTICPSGICFNMQGSYRCGTCPPGLHGRGGQCEDINECLDHRTCSNGVCTNSEGSFSCSCFEGFQSLQGKSCQDVDECQDERVCTRGHCRNTQGSFICSCDAGFTTSPTGDNCDDVDECVEQEGVCEGVGRCVNDVGSYHCSCPLGYQQMNSTSCLDVNECVDEPDLCAPNGVCANTEGSYQCVCDIGFELNPNTDTCDDVDECAALESPCGPHGFCENMEGRYRCACDQGYQEVQDGRYCEDVNECELLSAVCGEALCENVEGSFLCTCPDGHEYNTMNATCSPLATEPAVERKECYYRLNDENLCESVLTSHVTLEECCCTLGAGWGDNCEVHPCPVNGTDQFNHLCPSGRGVIPHGEPVFGEPTADRYRDADECALFGPEVCKGGFCLDTVGSYECYCQTGQDYDLAKLECRDINECEDDSVCVDGECLNTDGTYMCFCTHPMVLDPHGNHCVFPPDVAEHRDAKQIDYQGICWQEVTSSMTCTRPLSSTGPSPTRRTTYTECCCLYGDAWGMDCALCPPKNTEDYASMCNLPLSGGRRPYGRDALVSGPVHSYEPRPEEEEASREDYPSSRLYYAPQPNQDQALVPMYHSEDEEDPYDAFEGLRAEECGILNGCENGRCVRVQEGYTCDCFDGYTLDMSRMACIDVNECSELNRRMSLCKNAKCINTPGSYRCVCLPGFSPSERPNYCVARGAKDPAVAMATVTSTATPTAALSRDRQ
ncbi:latent-transforming growth factor beta-binding protein 1 isoform X3 [Gadus chalcogrammus]|uniref:latent-transforming growth factor beta-binding protein 1 isoform X3 n=1 Tax=Gadus chalcogrammus TaxID=1042646 RepID=UPI0024C4BD6E|nr:latent-transforming growth factor beta-binding protein 1 isoform X3 [Gadus chalcogrammus]